MILSCYHDFVFGSSVVDESFLHNIHLKKKEKNLNHL